MDAQQLQEDLTSLLQVRARTFGLKDIIIEYHTKVDSCQSWLHNELPNSHIFCILMPSQISLASTLTKSFRII